MSARSTGRIWTTSTDAICSLAIHGQRVGACAMADDEKVRGAINPIDPTEGLHVLKNRFQKKYMGEQCEALLINLDDAIEHTLRMAPVRDRDYLVDHTDARDPVHAEAQLER